MQVLHVVRLALGLIPALKRIYKQANCVYFDLLFLIIHFPLYFPASPHGPQYMGSSSSSRGGGQVVGLHKQPRCHSINQSGCVWTGETMLPWCAPQCPVSPGVPPSACPRPGHPPPDYQAHYQTHIQIRSRQTATAETTLGLVFSDSLNHSTIFIWSNIAMH